MRKIRFKPVAALAAVLVPLMAAAGVITHTATYDYSNLTLGTDTLGGVTYTTVNYDGLYNGGDPGMPSLPIDYLRFSVPYNATNFRVTAVLGDSVTIGIGQMVYPCQMPRMIDDSTPRVVILPDNTAYYSNAPYPSQNACVIDESFFAGENRIVTVAVFPVGYRHGTVPLNSDTISLKCSIALTLNYDICNSYASAPIVHQGKKRYEGFQLAIPMVVNPSDVPSNAPSINQRDSINRLSLHLTPMLFASLSPADSLALLNSSIPDYEYLVITTDSLMPSLKRLIALKRQMGYSAGAVTVEEIMKNPLVAGGDFVNNHVAYTDSAGIVRQFLRLAYGSFAKYVFLVGTSVPFRYYPNGSYPPSDLYYSDLSGDWSVNSNIDLYPELFVGRLLAKTKAQVNNYTDKLFRYQFNPGNDDRSYLKRALYTESADMTGESVRVRAFMDSICPNVTTIQEWKWHRFPTGTDIINEINSTEFGYLSTHNHGGPSTIICYGQDSNEPNVVYDDPLNWLWAIDTVKIANYYNAHLDPETGNGLNNLTNKMYPSIFYSISCTTMPYDVLPGFEAIPMNFGESFTTGKEYGGPAYLGNTRSGYVDYSADLEKLFAQQIQQGSVKLGMAEAMSKANHPHWNILNSTHNLLGDPDLEMWTDIPSDYSNIAIARTDTSITVSGMTAAQSIIAYCSNDCSAGTDTTSLSTLTIKNVSPNSTIMLYRHNYIPYIAPLVIQNATLDNSQYVIASDVTAGTSVDSGRTSGQVTVTGDIEYEIEHTGEVRFEGGFRVDKGVYFSVKPSYYYK